MRPTKTVEITEATEKEPDFFFRETEMFSPKYLALLGLVSALCSGFTVPRQKINFDQLRYLSYQPDEPVEEDQVSW